MSQNIADTLSRWEKLIGKSRASLHSLKWVQGLFVVGVEGGKCVDVQVRRSQKIAKQRAKNGSLLA